MSFMFGGSKSKSKTNENVTQDPWAPAIPYLTQALSEGGSLYDQFKDLSPEEQAAMQQQLGVIGSRLSGDSYDQVSGAGSKLLDGTYAPNLKDVSADRIYANAVLAPDDVKAGTVSAPQVNAAAARASQGVLNPTGALSKILSGQADNPQLDAMADAATRQGQRTYQDAVEDSTKALTRSVLPAVRSGAMLAGGYGGSRQGIAEGVAIGDQETALARGARDLGIASTDASANLRGNAYESAQNRMATAADNLDARAQAIAEGNADRGLSAQQFNTSNDLAAQKENVDNDIQVGTTNANLVQDAQKTNAQNQITTGTTNNNQQLQRADTMQGVLSTGADLLGKGSDYQDADFQNLMSVLGLPRTTAYGAYQNWVAPTTDIAGLGGTKNGTSSTKSSNLSISIGKK